MSNEDTTKREIFDENVEPKRTFILEPLNEAIIQGTIHEEFKYSHRDFRRLFYRACIAVKRKSRTSDYIYIIADADTIKKTQKHLTVGTNVEIKGKIYSCTQKHGRNNRLYIYIYAREIYHCDENLTPNGNKNTIIFSGTIGKEPHHKTSPVTQRKITEFLAIVLGRNEQKYSIPCICWGDIAEDVKDWEIGDKFEAEGRLQSRIYFRVQTKEYIEVHEVSVSKITKI